MEAFEKQVGHKVDFWDMYHYLDSAFCEKYAGRKILPVLEDNTEHRKTYDFIFMFDMINKLFSQEAQLRATSTGFFNRTMHDFKRIEKNTAGVQWVLYSAHDTTIGNFISRLNMTNVDCLY